MYRIIRWVFRVIGRWTGAILAFVYRHTWRTPVEIRGFWFTASLWALVISLSWLGYETYLAEKQGIHLGASMGACTVSYALFDFFMHRKRGKKKLPHLRRR